MEIECRRSLGCIRKQKTFATAVEYARHLIKVHKDRPAEAAMAAADEIEKEGKELEMKKQQPVWRVLEICKACLKQPPLCHCPLKE